MLAMTLLVRDEIDIIAHHVAHHAPKVDLLIITDNGSADGTREYLALVEGPRLVVIDEPAHDFKQDAWVDRMIRTAIERGASWIVNSDADEFWIGDLRAAVAKYGASANALRVPSHLMTATDQDDGNEPNPLRRIQHRIVRPRSVEAKCQPVWNKMLHAAAGWKGIVLGNHDVIFQPGTPKRIVDIPEIEAHIRHYPERGWEHYRQKYIQGGEAYAHSGKPAAYGWHWRQRYAAYCAGGISALRDLWRRESLVSGADVDQICVRDPWPA